MYPLEKYRYYHHEKKNTVYAVSTYAGETVKGKAKCAPGDNFDFEKGKRLAALRCAEKIAEKRMKRARSKVYEAEIACAKAEGHLESMQFYLMDARKERGEIRVLMDKLLEDM